MLSLASPVALRYRYGGGARTLTMIGTMTIDFWGAA